VLLRAISDSTHKRRDRGGLRSQENCAKIPAPSASHPKRRHGRNGLEKSPRPRQGRIQVGHRERGAVRGDFRRLNQLGPLCHLQKSERSFSRNDYRGYPKGTKFWHQVGGLCRGRPGDSEDAQKILHGA